MGDPSTMMLRPSFRVFLLWSGLFVGSIVGLCAGYHVAWPFSHPIPNGRVAEYIGYSALTCFLLALFLLLFFIVPASIIYALHKASWEASPEGVAMYRKGQLSRAVPWGEITRVRAAPMGVRLHLRTRVEPVRLIWVPWSDARSFARYCNEQIGQGSRGTPKSSV
jgi:hypothetical protein